MHVRAECLAMRRREFQSFKVSSGGSLVTRIQMNKYKLYKLYKKRVVIFYRRELPFRQIRHIWSKHGDAFLEKIQ